MLRLRPSTKAISWRPCRKAATTPVDSPGDRLLRNPISGFGNCACAASGHAAAPPMTVMNSRLLIRASPSDHRVCGNPLLPFRSVGQWRICVTPFEVQPVLPPLCLIGPFFHLNAPSWRLGVEVQTLALIKSKATRNFLLGLIDQALCI